MAGTWQDQVVWITGGGTGLGRAIALEMAAQGARVAVSGRRADKLEAVVSEIEGAGGTCAAVPCDVTQDGTLRDAVTAIVERWGQLDVAIANAGFAVSGTVEETPLDEWRRQLDINVIGLVATVQAALPELRRTKGRIALIGSVASMLVFPKGGPYCASKYAVRAIGQTLSVELHGSGVSCTTIYPGFVESDIYKVDNQGQVHDDWKDRRPAKLMWSSDKAARVMVSAIRRRKREFVFTGHGTVGAWLGRHMPGFAHFAMTRSSASG